MAEQNVDTQGIEQKLAVLEQTLKQLLAEVTEISSTLSRVLNG